jgi:hypothetical protein
MVETCSFSSWSLHFLGKPQEGSYGVSKVLGEEPRSGLVARKDLWTESVSAIGWDGKRVGGTQQSCPGILIFDRLKLYSVHGVREVSQKARGVGGWMKEEAQPVYVYWRWWCISVKKESQVIVSKNSKKSGNLTGMTQNVAEKVVCESVKVG